MSGKPKVSPRNPRPRPIFAAPPPVREPDPGNLPEVSKQTAGGIAGAMVGGVVAGPVGAVVGGVVGAMVGNASAQGKRPIGKTVDNIRAVTEEPARKAYARISNAMSRKAKPAKKPAAGKATAGKPATKKAPASRGAAKKTPAKKTSKA